MLGTRLPSFDSLLVMMWTEILFTYVLWCHRCNNQLDFNHDGNNSRGACCDTAWNINCYSSCYNKLKSIDQSIYVRAPADPLILALKFCLLGMVLWCLLLVLSLVLISRFFISSSLSTVASFLHLVFSYTSYIILTFIVVFFNNWTYSITRSCYYRACDAICR